MTLKISNETDKFCINCISYKGWRWPYALNDTHGSCGFKTHEQHTQENQCMKDLESATRHPVNGLIIYKFNHANAIEVRLDANACGLEGKWFELHVEINKNLETNYNQGKPTEGTISTEVFNTEQLIANRTAAQAKIAAIKSRQKLTNEDLENL